MLSPKINREDTTVKRYKYQVQKKSIKAHVIKAFPITKKVAALAMSFNLLDRRWFSIDILSITGSIVVFKISTKFIIIILKIWNLLFVKN